MKTIAILLSLTSFFMPRTFQASAEEKGAHTEAGANKETAKKEPAKKDAAKEEPAKPAATEGTSAKTGATEPAAENVSSTENSSHAAKSEEVEESCLVSEEAVADLQAREQRLEEQTAALASKEEELKALESAIKKQLAELDESKKQIKGLKETQIAQNEEKVKRLIDTFETMSPKAAAKVIAEVDESLAVVALSRLSTTKAGKILSNLKPEQASKLSEMMAMGTSRKEGNNAESNKRAPASQR